MIRVRTIVALLFALLATSVFAKESEFTFDAWAGPELSVRLFVPETVQPDTKIVIVMHGASRDAPRYYRDWRALGEKLDLIVVVPEFPKSKFKGSARYNLGFVFDPESGQRRAEEEWTFSAIEPLFDAVRNRIGGEQSGYVLYGHSAGSQFVHRFMYYKPDARVSRYIAANAGWYTLPTNEFEYPYGLDGAGVDESLLEKIFAMPVVILLGKEDTNQTASTLRKTPEARAQGPHRLARGYTMYRTAKGRAEELDLTFNWQIFVVKGADHNNAKMTPAAAAIAAH
ncbi:MAG: alpha/beta hydrolase [Gammaproteobacteria bacterium]|nr:alpha/beta hydrolase [Gammaproteobacteria bacterium]